MSLSGHLPVRPVLGRVVGLGGRPQGGGAVLITWLSPAVVALVTGRGCAARVLHCGLTLVLPFDTVPLIRMSPCTALTPEWAQPPPLGGVASTRISGAWTDSASLARVRIRVRRAAVLQRDLILASLGPGELSCVLACPRPALSPLSLTRSLSLSGITRSSGSWTRPWAPGAWVRDRGLGAQGGFWSRSAGRAGRLRGRAPPCRVRRSLAWPHVATCRKQGGGAHRGLRFCPRQPDTPLLRQGQACGPGSSFVGRSTASPTHAPSALPSTNPAPLPPPLQGGPAELHTGDWRLPGHPPWASPDPPGATQFAHNQAPCCPRLGLPSLSDTHL